MKKFRWIGVGLVIVVLGATVFLGYHRWNGRSRAGRGELLSLMPPGASAVLFADFDELRPAPFIGHFYAWLPKPQADPEYAQFVKDTGFDYERDLDRIAIAVVRRGKESTLFALIDGKFDLEKIPVYGSRSETAASHGGYKIFSVPMTGSPKKISFAFLSKDRIALTDAADLGIFLNVKNRNEDAVEWRTRFERLAGSPIFAVIRQDAGAGSALAAEAPAGLRSPQLSSLLDQLQWITLAGKPDNELLRVVAEGECATDRTVQQLADLLHGVVILAQAGLNDAKTRQHLDPAAREAYLELLKSADVSKIDRGDTKSVRLVLEITPKFLAAARTVTPVPPDASQDQTVPKRSAAQKKGRT
jgi:hypothetical protein